MLVPVLDRERPLLGISSATLKTILVIVTICAVCLVTYFTWRELGRPIQGIDDAEIFFVYARNFTQGYGIVYSVGAGHVEGYSSVLYFAICCFAFALRHSPEFILFCVNLFFSILTSLFILKILKDFVDGFGLSNKVLVLLAAFYLLWILSNPFYFAWSVVSLMDTGVYSLVITALFAMLANLILTERDVTYRDGMIFAMWIVFAVLCRPEGIFWAVLSVFGWTGLCLWRSRSLAGAYRFGLPLAALLLTEVSLLLFRLKYFGYPLPNTYYAKVSSSFGDTFSGGHHYFLGFNRFYGPFLWIPLVLTVFLLVLELVAHRRLTRLVSFSVLTAVFGFAGLAGPVLEGGDHFGGFRLFQPIMPLLFFAFMVSPLLAMAWMRRVASPFLGLLVSLTFYAVLFAATTHSTWARFSTANQLAQAFHEDPGNVLLDFTLGDEERVIGTRLREFFGGPLPTVGVAAAGGFAFGYQGPVYDMLGLNDVQMAHANRHKTGAIGHRSFDANVFYQIAPDLLNPGILEDGSRRVVLAKYADFMNRESFENIIYKDIFHEPRFMAEYVFGTIVDDTKPGLICVSFIKRSYLPQLLASPKIHVNLVNESAR